MRRRWQGRVANAGDIPIRAPETAVQAVPLVRVPLPGVVTGMGKRRSDDAHEETLAGRGERRVVRLLRLVTLLQRRKRGLRLAELITEFNVTRQTIYKYLDDVEAAGVPLDRAARHGEAWVKLDGDWLTPPGAAELFALVVARQALQGLPGSAAHQWLTPRLRELTTPRITVDAVAFAGVGAAEIEHALINDKRLRIDYRGLKDDEPKSRVIEPIELRFSQRAWYVFALDVDRQEPRTFKLARITRAVALDEACAFVGAVDAEHEHENAVSVWTSADVHDVEVRIHPPQARVAHEYPLTRQQVVVADGDAVIVRAQVSGLEEVTRWVLRWGRDAEVLGPPALLTRLREDVALMQRRLG